MSPTVRHSISTSAQWQKQRYFPKAWSSLQSLAPEQTEACICPTGTYQICHLTLLSITDLSTQYKAQEAELLACSLGLLQKPLIPWKPFKAGSLTPHFIWTEQIFFSVQNMMIPETWEAHPVLCFLFVVTGIRSNHLSFNLGIYTDRSLTLNSNEH